MSWQMTATQLATFSLSQPSRPKPLLKPAKPEKKTMNSPVQIATILCLWGLVIGAVYMLRAYRNIFQGDLSKASAYATGLQLSLIHI